MPTDEEILRRAQERAEEEKDEDQVPLEEMKTQAFPPGFPALRPVRDEVVLEFTAVAGEPLLGWDLKSEKRVMVVDKSPSPEEGYNKHQLILTPVRPNEIDAMFLDVKLITRPGENTIGFAPEHWLSKVKVGYGWGNDDAWVKSPLYAWESRILNSFSALSSFTSAMRHLDEFAKNHPGLVRGICHDFREYLRREADRHDAAMKFLTDMPRATLSVLAKTWYTKSFLNHRSQARHWFPGEDLYLYIEPDEIPMSQVRFAVIIWAMGYHKISKFPG